MHLLSCDYLHYLSHYPIHLHLSHYVTCVRAPLSAFACIALLTKAHDPKSVKYSPLFDSATFDVQ